MKICIGCDHRGIGLKEQLKVFLEREGCTDVDKGTSSEDSVDYPDFGALVSKDVSQGMCDRGGISMRVGKAGMRLPCTRTCTGWCGELEES